MPYRLEFFNGDVTMPQDLTPDESGDTRYTLLLDPQARQIMERLGLSYGLKNWAEVYELSIRIMRWMTDQIAIGHEIGRSRNGEFQELILPNLPDINVWLQGDPALNWDKPPSNTLH